MAQPGASEEEKKAAVEEEAKQSAGDIPNISNDNQKKAVPAQPSKLFSPAEIPVANIRPSSIRYPDNVESMGKYLGTKIDALPSGTGKPVSSLKPLTKPPAAFTPSIFTNYVPPPQERYYRLQMPAPSQTPTVQLSQARQNIAG